MKATKAVAFEDAIVNWLVTSGGYTRGIPNYDPAFALDSAELFTFLGATQADEWEGLAKQIDDRRVGRGGERHHHRPSGGRTGRVPGSCGAVEASR